MDVQRTRYAVSAQRAPTHVIKRYNVNINTCFHCSQDMLTEDLVNDSQKDGKANLDYYF